MKSRHDLAQRPHTRGAIATKLAIVVALGAGVFWSAPFKPRTTDGAAPDLTGSPVAQNKTPQLPVTNAGSQAAPQSEGDPFAGVDVSSSPVLRYINGISEPKRTEPAAEPQAKTALTGAAAPKRGSAADAMRAVPPARPNASVTESTPLPPVATERTAKAEAQPRPNEAAAPAPGAATLAAASPAVAAVPVAGPAPTAVPAPAAAAPATAAPSPDAARLALGLAEPAPVSPPVIEPPRATHRTVPAFPNEAIKAGIKTGRVLARVSIDADGRVTDSQILSARPPGYFERESQRALTHWRYEAPGRATSTEVELLFARD